MAIQTVNLGTAPTGAGGDTFRSTGAKINENFTNPVHAASRMVGMGPGDLSLVVDLRRSLGQNSIATALPAGWDLNNLSAGDFAFYSATANPNSPPLEYGTLYASRGYADDKQLHVTGFDYFNGGLVTRAKQNGIWSAWAKHYHTLNTTVDSNGFIKAASPVIQLFTDKIQANAEALLQNPEFEKVDVGHYLIKGTEGFAQEGWWIEVPTDSNGNKICAVEYQTLDSGDLEVKTFKKKLNEDGDIVANLDAPVDIPSNKNGEPRWIDIRLHSTPKPIVQKILRTEKQPRMVQQIKYAPQLTYITKYQDLFDDAGNPVIVDGKQFQKPVTNIHTDQNGTPILTNQQVMNDKGEVVFEWVQVVDADNKPIFDDVPVLDGEGNQIYDEVMNESQQ